MDIIKPVQEFSIPVESCLVDPRCIGVDFGTERTKLAYPSELGSESGTVGKSCLNFATFATCNNTVDCVVDYLSEKLHDLKSAGNDKDGYATWKLRETGAGSNQVAFRDLLKQRLGLEVEFVDEAKSECRGASFLMRHCSQTDTCHPPPFIDPAEFAGLEHGETFKKFNEAQSELAAGKGGGSQFPCLLTVFGSTCRVFLVQEDGSGEEMHTQNLAGKSFLGICQLFTGVSSYPALMSMAASGKRGNIDLQVRELLEGSEKSPYGRLPPSLAVFPFGKAVDNDASFEETRPEDLVHSLVASFGSNLIYTVTQLALFNGATSLRFSGGFFNHESPRAELMKTGKLFTPIDSMNVEFLKIDHTAALGAMLSN